MKESKRQEKPFFSKGKENGYWGKLKNLDIMIRQKGNCLLQLTKHFTREID